MSDPVVLRVHRPYADEAAYIAAEWWSIDDKAVLLIDQPPLAKDTVVRFEIVLDDGSKPIRAEGKVHKSVPADGDHPAGLRVRFRRFDAATKRFIDSVMAERRRERRSRRPPPAELEPLVLDPEPSSPSDAAASERAPAQSGPEVVSQPLASQPAPESAPAASATRSASDQDAEATMPNVSEAAVDTAVSAEHSERGVARSTPASGPGPRSVSAPPNRDELLARLRERAKARAGG
ncbi:MAG: hypothetical protein IPI67_16190 [Myxococcales bacterium]|nr:hypothetical protein [Myxococcales bacterium]